VKLEIAFFSKLSKYEAFPIHTGLIVIGKTGVEKTTSNQDETKLRPRPVIVPAWTARQRPQL
jgi:hypothetical protein